MKCPRCHHDATKVVDSRALEEGVAIRRRRECEKCEFRFSTYEELELLNVAVKKRDGRTESYNQEKLIQGVKRALEKRPMTPAKVKRVIQAIENDIQRDTKNDTITSSRIGELVMKHLRRADKVAYLRFASVYESFEDLDSFQETLDNLTKRKIKKTV